jgi:hypothetical protein
MYNILIENIENEINSDLMFYYDDAKEYFLYLLVKYKKYRNTINCCRNFR